MPRSRKSLSSASRTPAGASRRWRRRALPGRSIAAEELVDWTNQRVAAKFQRIREVVFRAEFPRTVAGKTLKRQMRRDYGAG